MSLRTVQHACKDGRVPGAKKVNKEWLVPINAMSPIDARTAKGRTIKALGIDYREKETFVTDTWTSVIHNVRNALSTIMGYADLIRLKEGDTEKILEYVEHIQKAGTSPRQLRFAVRNVRFTKWKRLVDCAKHIKYNLYCQQKCTK